MARWKWPAVFGGLGLIMALLIIFLVGGLKLSQDRLQNIVPVSGVVFGDLVDIRGQIHVHSHHSHDSSGTAEEIVKAAKSAGVSWVILTDHDSEFSYSQSLDDTLLIFGSEDNRHSNGSKLDYKDKFSAYGHIEKVQNGEFYEWDAIEIVNLHANILKKDYQWRVLKSLFVNPTGFYQELTRVMPENIGYWQTLSERLGKPVPIFAATDAHSNIRFLGVRIDPYDFVFKMVSTHIFLNLENKLNADSVIQAIKKGRTYVAFDYLGDPTGFQFLAKKGKKQILMGDTVIVPEGLEVYVPLLQGGEIRIFRNNDLVAQQINVQELFIKTPRPGFWRVEVYRDGLPWIISGQILIK